MRRKLGLAVVAGLLGVALALTATACGGGEDGDGVASLTPTTGQTTTGDQGSGNNGSSGRDREEAALEYAKCMREHGVDFPDPVNGRFNLKSERGDQRKLKDAQKACQDILENAMPPLSEEQESELREAALEFAKCMREHGVDMPDPTFPKGGGILQRMPLGTDEDDPKVEEARKACEPILEAAKPDGLKGKDGSS
jgi:hypothetical protein